MHQAAGVIAVVMTENHVGDVGEFDAKLSGIVENGLGAGAGIEQERWPSASTSAAETPFPNPLGVGHHRRQDHDVEPTDARCGRVVVPCPRTSADVAAPMIQAAKSRPMRR